jgi:hypothetical protein
MGFEAPRTKALQHRSGMQYGAARAAHGGADAHTTDKVQRSANRQDLRIGTAPCEVKVKDGRTVGASHRTCHAAAAAVVAVCRVDKDNETCVGDGRVWCRRLIGRWRRHPTVRVVAGEE